MNIYTLNRKALSLCLMVAVFATYSLTALASPPKVAGEIIVTGKSLGDKTGVTINGNAVENGSSVFSSSSISTPNSSSAVINVGKIGRVQLAPSTNLKLNFDESNFNGVLSQGKVMVLSASKGETVETTFKIKNIGNIRLAPNTSVSLSVTDAGLVADLLAGSITSISTNKNMVVNTPNGESVKLMTGETVTSSANANVKKGGAAWWWFALIFGGAVAGILIAANTDNNRLAFGGSGTVVSPTQ